MASAHKSVLDSIHSHLARYSLMAFLTGLMLACASPLKVKGRGRGRKWAREWSEAYRVDSCASGLFQIALAVAGPIAVSARSL
jgi:hypothetical protein